MPDFPVDEKLSLSLGSVDQGWLTLARHYLNLTKPTISLLVTLSALPAFLIPMTSLPSLMASSCMLLGVYLLSSSAAVFNQVLEWQTDKTMSRTRSRSLPMGLVSRTHASLFGSLLGLAGFWVLYSSSYGLAAFIGLVGHLYYVVLYTLVLKKRTVQNIVIGGAAGAVGPLMGAAAAGQLLRPEPWILFALIVLWTPPHFWSLSLKYQGDYAAAGIPMYPVIYGENRTKKMIFLYSLTLIPISLALFKSGLWISATLVLLLTFYFVYLCGTLYRQQTNQGAMQLFHFSCVYALAIFIFLSVEKSLILWLAS